jgi:hypothetical protein
VDLYKRYRAYHSFFGWPDQKLKTLERFLGIDREDPFTGGELIEVYREYARTEDEQLAKALLLHNGEDIENMPALLCIEDFWQTGHTCRVLGACRQGDTLSFELDRQMPMSAEGYEGDKHWIFRAGEARAELRRPLYEGELRYYLPRYQDYYYLPETNEIVHRSLAGRIPASQRRKASRDVCYLSKKGAFWPGREGECGSLRAYRREAKDAAAYYEVDELSAWLQAQKEEELTQWFRSLWK